MLGLVIWAVSAGSNTAEFLAKMQSSPYGIHGKHRRRARSDGLQRVRYVRWRKAVKQIAFSFWGMSAQQEGT